MDSSDSTNLNNGEFGIETMLINTSDAISMTLQIKLERIILI